MSRTAILPTPGDPFLLRFWLNHFTQVWSEEVDELIVSINTFAEPEVVEYLKQLVLDTPKATLLFKGQQTDHGLAINEALDVAGDLVLLIEDDAFVLRKGKIEGCFAVIERGERDIIGSPRGSCSEQIWDAVRDRWGLLYSNKGDVGPNFWPNFFFARRDDLTSTDRQFCSQGWQDGEMIEPLGIRAHGLVNGDTFVNTSLQLRAREPRIAVVPQYHGHPDDMENRAAGKGLWDGECPWLHVGSLSSLFSGVLTDAEGRPLSRRTVAEAQPEGWELPKYCNTEMERLEWERRMAWVVMAVEAADADPSNPLPEFRKYYHDAIDRVVAQYGLSLGRIIRSIVGYKELMTWTI